MTISQLKLKRLQTPVGWGLAAMESAEGNDRDASYVIDRLSIIYDSDKPSFASEKDAKETGRILGMLEFLKERRLIVTKHGAVAWYRKPRVLQEARGANLSITYNLGTLSGAEAGYLLSREYIPGMTLFTIDMDAFENPQHPLLIKTIGWWENDPSPK